MNPWPISPLTEKELSFSSVNYDFSGLTAEETASLPNLETAIDASLLESTASVADQETLIASMDDDLNDLPNILKEMATDDFEQIAADLAGIAAKGDGLLNDFASVLG
ncbi:MAG TPA: hypothetical protein VE077_17665 [Candidatus Methylomirabilis sp.]|nr:hypothetical protein [Candidatus Methylomirabilis sp.]